MLLLVIDSGRTMVCQYYFVQSSDVQETLRVYDTIHGLNTVRLSALLTVNCIILTIILFEALILVRAYLNTLVRHS